TVAGLALPKSNFGLLLRSDIEDRADQPDGLSARKMHKTARFHPPFDGRVDADHAQRNAVHARTIGLQRRADRLLGLVAVVRMDRAEEEVECRNRIRLDTPDFAHPLVAADLPRLDVAIMGAEARCIEGQLRPLFT